MLPILRKKNPPAKPSRPMISVYLIRYTPLVSRVDKFPINNIPVMLVPSEITLDQSRCPSSYVQAWVRACWVGVLTWWAW
jgi:hypothetical protein